MYIHPYQDVLIRYNNNNRKTFPFQVYGDFYYISAHEKNYETGWSKTAQNF
jgi:hypothetical protein